MIKFFRKIRQNLLSDNKASKYLLYAIGEIVLVVIGILIAIQLNQWRNDSQNYTQRQKILQALKVEFQSNLEQLENVLDFNNKTRLAVKQSNLLINSDLDTIDTDSLYEPTRNLAYTFSFNPINGALESAISSGEIHLINNERLIELLFSWEYLVNDSQEEVLRIRNYQSSSTPFLRKYIRLREQWKILLQDGKGSAHPSDFIALYQDPLFEDYVIQTGFNAWEYFEELDNMKSNNTEILELIDEELSN